jgi:hypothetical protein
MTTQNPGRRPEQQADHGARRQAEHQHQQHHDPRGSGGKGSGLASQTPKGGTSQDGFGQSGGQGSPTQTEHNASPGSDD